MLSHFYVLHSLQFCCLETHLIFCPFLETTFVLSLIEDFIIFSIHTFYSSCELRLPVRAFEHWIDFNWTSAIYKQKKDDYWESIKISLFWSSLLDFECDNNWPFASKKYLRNFQLATPRCCPILRQIWILFRIKMHMCSSLHEQLIFSWFRQKAT